MHISVRAAENRYIRRAEQLLRGRQLTLQRDRGIAAVVPHSQWKALFAMRYSIAFRPLGEQFIRSMRC